MSKTRPYMVIYTRYVPKAGVDTRQSNWAAGGNLESIERFETVDRLSNRHRRDASFIIDLLDMTTVKNSTALDETKMLNYYLKKYSTAAANGVSEWLTRQETENGA